MSGVTKHIYDRKIIDINIMWNSQLKKIEKVLPCIYNEDIIIDLLKKYYPHEWKSVEYKKQYYDQKDKYLIKRFGKARYKMPFAEEIIRNNVKFKYLLSDKTKSNYSSSFDEDIWKKNKDALWRERKNKIARIDTKISNAKAKTQMVTPVFLDQLIGLYNKINTSQKDRMYIIHELKKYYNPKVIKFFFKLNDTELNKQLREIAFYHLQSFNYQPRLRRQKYMQVHTKRKKRKECAAENSDKAFIDIFDDFFSKCIDQYDDVFFHTLNDSDVLCRVVPEWGWDESRFIPWDNIDNMNRWNPPGKTYLYLSFDENERKYNDELSVSEYICLEEYRAEKDNKYSFCHFKPIKKGRILDLSYNDVELWKIEMALDRYQEIVKDLFVNSTLSDKAELKKMGTTKRSVKRYIKKNVADLKF